MIKYSQACVTDALMSGSEELARAIWISQVELLHHGELLSYRCCRLWQLSWMMMMQISRSWSVCRHGLFLISADSINGFQITVKIAPCDACFFVHLES